MRNSRTCTTREENSYSVVGTKRNNIIASDHMIIRISQETITFMSLRKTVNSEILHTTMTNMLMSKTSMIEDTGKKVEATVIIRSSSIMLMVVQFIDTMRRSKEKIINQQTRTRLLTINLNLNLLGDKLKE